MKTMKKTVAVLLCLVMMSVSFCTVSFAEEELFYVVLGDSIAWGTGLMNAEDACYGKIVADTCGYDYANYGVDGHTSQNLIERLSETKVIEDVKRADIISISIGGNDFRKSGMLELLFDVIVKEDYEKADKVAESYYNNLCTIMSIINENNPDAVVLMQTMYNPQLGTVRDAYQEAADRINEAILRYTQEYPGEMEVIDVGTALGDDGDNFAGDAMHPSAQGNEIIAKLIVDRLAELGLTDKTEIVVNEKGITNILYIARAVEILGVIFGALNKIYSVFNRTKTVLVP